MPYSLDTLPEAVQKLPAIRQRQWRDVWNSAYARAKRVGKSDKDAEGAAFAQANGVIGNMQASTGAPVSGTEAAFTIEAVPTPLYDDGETVYRDGFIFAAGEYPDKAFSLSPAELHDAVTAFAPGDALVDLEHQDTVLSGRLGEVVSLRASDDGAELHGLVALPKWFDDALGSVERKVSATWNRQTKRLEGLALVLNPRVEKAALMAAFAAAQEAQVNDKPQVATDGLAVNAEQLRTIAEFAVSRHDTPEGQSTLQLVHDVSARSGAVCTAPGDQASMASRHEADALQQVHDLSAGHGAQCSGGSASATHSAKPKKEGSSLMSGIKEFFARFAEMPEERLQQLVTNEAASTVGSTPGALVAPAATVTATAPAVAATFAQPSDNERHLRDQLTAQQEENRRIRAERIAEQAAFFADHYIKGEHRAFPAERAAIMQAYIQCASDDLLLPGSVTFADGKPATRVDILKATYDSRPGHQLTAEQLAPGIFAALANKDTTLSDAQKDSPLNAEQLRNLIGRTTLGQAMLDHTDRNGVATNGTSR